MDESPGTGILVSREREGGGRSSSELWRLGRGRIVDLGNTKSRSPSESSSKKPRPGEALIVRFRLEAEGVDVIGGGLGLSRRRNGEPRSGVGVLEVTSSPKSPRRDEGKADAGGRKVEGVWMSSSGSMDIKSCVWRRPPRRVSNSQVPSSSSEYLE